MLKNIRHIMEMTFYEDQPSGNVHELSHMKRHLKLDLSCKSKKPRLNPSVQCAPVLSSPDLNMLKLASPELEKLIIDNSLQATPTPSGNGGPLFRAQVTEDEESYARGFVEALNELHQNDSSQGSAHQNHVEIPRSRSTSSQSSATYLTLEPHFPASNYTFPMSPQDATVLIKDEPQTVPSLTSTPPLSPIDMEDQERIKLERKRMRNRVAASKCRRRKLERIARLEDKVKILKNENAELSTVVHKLKEQVCHLKQQVIDHVQSGCRMSIPPF